MEIIPDIFVRSILEGKDVLDLRILYRNVGKVSRSTLRDYTENQG